MTVKKEKKVTLRQQMRVQAETTLEELMNIMEGAAQGIVAESPISGNDLMAICCKTQVNTIHDKLITQLANQAEADLVKLWNDQQKLDLGDNDAK